MNLKRKDGAGKGSINMDNALPQMDDLFSGDTYLFEFLLQAWGIIFASKSIGKKELHGEFDNVLGLSELLFEYLDENGMNRCKTVIDYINKIGEYPNDPTEIDALLERMPNNIFIDVFFKSRVIEKKTPINIDCEKYGAFAMSSSSDVITICRFLGNRIRDESALDLGSGNGSSAFIISQYVEKITGVEINRDLYLDSLSCMAELIELDRIKASSVEFINEDFFNVEFSVYGFIYIYWPYDMKEKEEWETITREKLEKKIKNECKPGTIIGICIPGIKEKNILPDILKIDTEEIEFQRQIHLYQIPNGSFEQSKSIYA